MGGVGSGNYFHWSTRNLTESSRRIDVRRWQREGQLTPGRWFSWQWTADGETIGNISVRVEAGRLLLLYRYREGGGEWQDVEEPVILDSSPGTYGGKRVWFRCPAVSCGRRVALLYLGGKYFACRHCYRLTYASTRRPAWDRWSDKADRIRKRLGWEPGMLNGPGVKPKWMRWRTYERLREQEEAYARASMRAASIQFGIPMEELF